MIPAHGRGPLGVSAGNQRFDTVLMGRATYEVGLIVGVTSPYPHLRQILVSTSVTSSPDPDVEVIAEDIVARIRAMKAESGMDIWLCGGARLAASLVGEIDELILKVYPVLIGAGNSALCRPHRATPGDSDRTHRLSQWLQPDALSLVAVI